MKDINISRNCLNENLIFFAKYYFQGSNYELYWENYFMYCMQLNCSKKGFEEESLSLN